VFKSFKSSKCPCESLSVDVVIEEQSNRVSVIGACLGLMC
jgi:hypothetical protein